MRLHSPLKRVKDYGVSMQKKNSHSPAQGGGALKLETATKYLSLSKPTIYRLVARGLLKPNRATRHLLFPVAELDRFLNT
jgi:excisionase family DNA binding protein